MSARVLVTGADGFVGKRLVASLQSNGYDVQTHSHSDSDVARDPLNFPDISHVYHLAARTFVPDSWTSPLEFYRVNVLGTVNVLEYCRRTGASATLISSYVYGIPSSDPIPESHPLSAFNPYGHTKILAEQVGSYFETAFGVRVSVVRPFNLYGPGQAASFLIPSILRQALDAGCRELTVLDDKPRRDYLYIDDFIALLLKFSDGQVGVYNAGSGQSHSVREVLDLINGLLDAPKPIICSGESRPQEVFEMKADISRALATLGWKPVVGLKDGLRLTMEYLLQEAKDGSTQHTV